MQSTYLNMGRESTTESSQHTRYQEPFSVHSFIHETSVSKQDFHNFAFSPQDRKRVKQTNLGDLPASTYCGSNIVSDWTSNRKQSNTAGKLLSEPVKSHSLNTEEGSPDRVGSLLYSKPLKEKHYDKYKIISTDNEQHFQSPEEKASAPTSGYVRTNRIRNKDLALMISEPAGLEKIETVKRLSDKNMNRTYFQGGDNHSNVGTQTEQAEHNKIKEYPAKYSDRERRAFKHLEGDSEIFSDDISDIFKFLDDMSVCDSLGVAESSCSNSQGSLSQVTLKTEGDSYPERTAVKLAKSKLDRLFHSLENTDDDLKSSVCKLVMRIGEIEKKLESLWGIPDEISQVLSKINMLAEKIQEPETNANCKEMVSASEPNATSHKPQLHHHLLPNTGLSPCVFQCHTTDHNAEMDIPTSREWCYSDGVYHGNLRFKPLKMSMSIKRWSHSVNKEESDNGSKVASFTSPLQDLRTDSYFYHCGYEGKDKDRNSKDQHQKAKETKDCLNPNNLEYWMEDINTSGYDSLLKRKEAEFWRAKMCKIGALIAASTCIVILVIIVPICILKT